MEPFAEHGQGTFVLAALLAGTHLCAADLVYPRGYYMMLSSAEKQSYARLDFPFWAIDLAGQDHQKQIAPRGSSLS